MENRIKNNSLEKILIVDDNPTYRDAAKRAFSSYDNVELSFAKNYTKAIEKIETNKYDEIFVDGFFNLGDGELSKGQKERVYSSVERYAEDLKYDRKESSAVEEKAQFYENLASSEFPKEKELPLSELLGEYLVSKNMDFMITTIDKHGQEETTLENYCKKKDMRFFIERNSEFPKDETGYWKRAYAKTHGINKLWEGKKLMIPFYEADEKDMPKVIDDVNNVVPERLNREDLRGVYAMLRTIKDGESFDGNSELFVERMNFSGYLQTAKFYGTDDPKVISNNVTRDMVDHPDKYLSKYEREEGMTLEQYALKAQENKPVLEAAARVGAEMCKVEGLVEVAME